MIIRKPATFSAWKELYLCILSDIAQLVISLTATTSYKDKLPAMDTDQALVSKRTQYLNAQKFQAVTLRMMMGMTLLSPFTPRFTEYQQRWCSLCRLRIMSMLTSVHGGICKAMA